MYATCANVDSTDSTHDLDTHTTGKWCHEKPWEVVTWGCDGGYSGDVLEQLHYVCNIQATEGAFAARRADGKVVTWGNFQQGGDSSDVTDQLTDVLHIQSTLSAFAAIKEDGTVVAWGNPSHGGDISAVKDQLTNVECVQCLGVGFNRIY